MTKKQCQSKWARNVAARDPHCQICEAGPTEAHHIILRAQGDPDVQFDTDYGVVLCPSCHRDKKDAPHESKQLFLDKIIPRLPWPRQQKILLYINFPQEVRPSQHLDYSAIGRRLDEEFKEIEEQHDKDWMDEGCETVFRGRAS